MVKWIRRLSEDSTNIVDSDLDESIFSPILTPRVLHQEVVVSIFGAVPNGEDSMVKVCSASLGNDTFSV